MNTKEEKENKMNKHESELFSEWIDVNDWWDEYGKYYKMEKHKIDDKLKLRLLTENDLKMVMEWRMMPEVTKYMYTDPQLDMNQQMDWFSKITLDDTCIHWIIEYDGKPIGLYCIADIDRVNKHCDWAYYIADVSYRGKHIGRNVECGMYDYMFDALKMHKAYVDVFTWNDFVVGLHLKYGSTIEGTFKDHIYKNGKYYDIVRLGLIADDWRYKRTTREFQKPIVEDNGNQNFDQASHIFASCPECGADLVLGNHNTLCSQYKIN